MNFILTDALDKAVLALGDKIIHELSAGNRVLWLTSGGSNIEAAVKIMNLIDNDLSRGLTVMPCDERYGPAGHKDSNWAQLSKAGFDPKSAKTMPALKDGLAFEETVAKYEASLEKAFQKNDVVILHLGMGPDGHVSGILPGSPAAREERHLTAGYDSPPYKRITTTFPALRRANYAYLFAFGPAKLEALQNLRDKNLPLSDQPAQILKELADSCVYSDQIGEPA